jgi:PEP-CTERM motif
MIGRKVFVAVGVGCVLLCSLRAGASAIGINNFVDTPAAFHTRVTGSVGLFPDIHFLVDIPGTPWESSSTIIESPPPAPLLFDILNVSWTIEHLLGPDARDVNPNPLGPTSLSLKFIPTVAGPFGNFTTVPCAPGGVFAIAAVNHLLVDGTFHVDDFCLDVWGIVGTDFFGNLKITTYNIEYYAEHCEVLDPTVAFGCGPFTAPEPATWLLLGTGVLVQARRLRRVFATTRR